MSDLFCPAYVLIFVVPVVLSVLFGLIHPDAVVLTHHHKVLETLISLYMKESFSFHFSECRKLLSLIALYP
jgi:hypothetical protein